MNLDSLEKSKIHMIYISYTAKTSYSSYANCKMYVSRKRTEDVMIYDIDMI